MPTGDTAPTQCFMSYKRDDNRDFNGVVDRLKADLSGIFDAETGKELHVFVDRDDIGWGQDWRQRIRESVESATVFIPVITMRYFKSGPCREELLAFHSNAVQLGVTELLLPVVLAGADQISADDPRDEVRLIDRLNYISIEQAWRAGYDSPLWKGAILDMVTHLKGAVATAETRLVTIESRTLGLGAAGADQPGSDDVAIVETSLASDVELLAQRLEALVDLGEETARAMGLFTEAAREYVSRDAAAVSAQQQRSRTISAAASLSEPAQDLSHKGSQFEQEVAATDAMLRQIASELPRVDLPQERTQVRQLVATAGDMGAVQETMHQMDELMTVLKSAALVNVSMRRAIQPAMRGLQAAKTAFSTVGSWKALV